MTALPSIDVVIVSWNTGPILHDCLRALLANVEQAQHAIGRSATIVVVDNGSDDGIQLPTNLRESITLVQNAANLGFAAACNQGASLGRADVLLFLNPDVVMGSGALTTLLAAFNPGGDASIGIAGVQLRNPQGDIERTCARRPTLPAFLATITRLSHVGCRGHLMTEWDHATSRDVDHVTGACYAVRRQAFEALGGFDNRFFVYFEDLDFSLRARDAGWAIRYMAEVSGVHRGGWAAGTHRGTRLYHDWRSRLAFARKHFGPFAAVAILAITLGVDPLLRLASATRRGSVTHIRDIVSACHGLVRGRPPVERRGIDV